jgi:tRNA-specific adenosine deaminase 1
MKCLPSSKLPAANGIVLHDTHAEVLTLRALNVFLLRQCHSILSNGSDSVWISQREPKEQSEDEPQPFKLKENVKIYMYGSEAPCGDASMELIMDSLDDNTPWAAPEDAADNLFGRGYFSQLGIVRRKPGMLCRISLHIFDELMYGRLYSSQSSFA